MRDGAIRKIKALRDYWREKADAAFRADDRVAYAQANEQLGSLLLPMERLSGIFYWYSNSPWMEAA